MKARGAVANVAAVRLKRLQHKQRRKVDFWLQRSGGATGSNQQETQTATTVGVVHSKNMRTSCIRTWRRSKRKKRKSSVFALFGAVRRCSQVFFSPRTIYAEVVGGEGEAQSWRLRVRR